MERTVEKSCWGITLWAVITVVGLMGVVTLVTDPPHVERATVEDAVQARVANSGAPAKISR